MYMENRDHDWLKLASATLCGVAIVVCCILVWRAEQDVSPAIPVAEVKRTNTAVDSIRRKTATAKRGIEERAGKTRERIVYVRREEERNVGTLSPDAVAVGVVDELQRFLRGVGSGDCVPVCSGGVSVTGGGVLGF